MLGCVLARAWRYNTYRDTSSQYDMCRNISQDFRSTIFLLFFFKEYDLDKNSTEILSHCSKMIK